MDAVGGTSGSGRRHVVWRRPYRSRQNVGCERREHDGISIELAGAIRGSACLQPKWLGWSQTHIVENGIVGSIFALLDNNPRFSRPRNLFCVLVVESPCMSPSCSSNVVPRRLRGTQIPRSARASAVSAIMLTVTTTKWRRNLEGFVVWCGPSAATLIPRS
jgi:hypothetical protein